MKNLLSIESAFEKDMRIIFKDDGKCIFLEFSFIITILKKCEIKYLIQRNKRGDDDKRTLNETLNLNFFSQLFFSQI